jgi:hypothetical protein
MKAFRGTAVLSLFVVLLAGYTAWEYKKASLHSGDTDVEKRLFYFVPDDVDSFRIKRPDSTVSVVHHGDEWQMIEPAKDLAEKSAVEAFLYSVMIQKGKVFRDADESKTTDLKQFGLDPAGAVIEINSHQKTESLSVSTKNAYDGSYYILHNGQVLLGDRGLAQIVARDPNSLRTKKLWRERDAVILSAEVEVNQDQIKDKFSLKKDGDSWLLDPKPPFAIDVHKIETWLAGLHALNPGDIASEKLSEAQKREFLLLKPSLKAHVTLKKADGKDGTWDVTVGQDRGDDVFMYTNLRDTVYRASASTLSALRVNRDYFRDGKSPFHFQLEQAHLIQVNGLKIEKDGSTWKLKDAPAGSELVQDQLTEFLHNLSRLEAQEYPRAKDAKGFKPEQTIRIEDAKGGVLLELSWGDEFKAREPWNKGMTFRFVKTNLDKEVLGVNSAKIASLTKAGLVATRAENKKTDKK